MEIIFEEEYLQNLYEYGKTKDKKYFLPNGVAKKYKETIDKLKAASTTTELLPINSLNYKKLSGDKKGIESVRVNLKYRIEFISENDAQQTLTICRIIALSNHYE